MTVDRTTMLSNPADEREIHTIEIPETWRIAVRIIFGTFLVVTGLLFAAALAVGYGQLRQVCVGTVCHPLQLSPAKAILNSQLGLSLDFYAAYITITYLVFGGVALTVSALIYWQRSDNWMSLFVAFVLVGVGIGSVPTLFALQTYMPAIAWYIALLRLALGCLPVLLFVFPDGRFVPQWSKWLTLVWAIYFVYTLIARPIPAAGITSGPPSFLSQLYFLAGGISQIYRFTQATSTLQRQQTKWALFGFIGHITSLLVLVNVLAIYGHTASARTLFIY